MTNKNNNMNNQEKEMEVENTANYDIVSVINELAEQEELFSIGEVEYSKIEAAQEALGVVFAKDFVEYVQKFGAIEIGFIELCGVTENKDDSVVERTQEMRSCYANFPKDCYMIEDIGMEGAVHVQFPDGKVYQYWDDDEEELMFVANSLGEYLQKMLEEE